MESQISRVKKSVRRQDNTLPVVVRCYNSLCDGVAKSLEPVVPCVSGYGLLSNISSIIANFE
jgi:hypothetical protein